MKKAHPNSGQTMKSQDRTEDRKERLAKALRRNLAKRKRQSMMRKDSDASDAKEN